MTSPETQKTCVRCGSKNNLVEHHLDGAHGAIFPDTIILCRKCHAWIHVQRYDAVIEYFRLRGASP